MKDSQKQTLLVFLVGILGVLVAAFGPRPLPAGNQHMRGDLTPAPNGSVKGISSSPNVKIAFYGDSHDGTNFRNVLNLMKNEASDAVVGLGDYDYSVPADANNYESIINSVFNNAFPFFLAVGNHDISEDGDYWRTTCSNGTRGCYATNFLARLQRLGYSDINATMLNNQMYSLDYQGVKIVFVGDDNFEGKGDSLYAPYIRSQLQNDTHDWKICVWHRTQNAMQLGTKGDSIGWQVYETCRQYGAIVITAHEHSYARTKTLTSIQNQIVDTANPDRNNLRVEPGKTFVAVSALGGQDIDRTQSRCAPTTYPYGCKGEWAYIYTKTQNAVQGALFLEFNVDGDPAKARGYFKNINGTVVDSFNITTTGSTGGGSSSSASTTSVAASTSPATSVATTTSTATTSVGGVSSGNWYGANSIWNTPIPSNATYTAETRIGTFRPVYEGWSAPVYRVPATENPPTVRVVNVYSGRVENWPIPSYALPAPEADAHMVVVFKERNIMYEMWAAEWVSGTQISAGGMKDYPYNGTGISNPPNYRVTASGFAVGAGMVIKENFTNTAGQLTSNMTINHALSMALPTSVISKTYIAPAVGGEEAGNNTNGLPMGARLALPKSLNVDTLNVHPMTKALLRAARDYGIYVNDGNGASNYNNKAVGTIRLEPGLTQALYGTANDDLLPQIGSEVFNVIAANGLYVVSGGTNTSVSTTTTSTVTSSITSSVISSSSSSATTSSSRPAACRADYNANGTLDISDFATFAANYKKTGISCSLDIVGGNCYLDVADFSQFASIYKVAGVCLP